MSCLLSFLLADGDLTDTVSGPRSTASDLTSSKASTKSPTQRHNPFNEEQAEAVSSSDATPVHTSSQEREPHPPELLDAGTELEVIRSAGRGCAALLSPGRQVPLFPWRRFQREAGRAQKTRGTGWFESRAA